MNVVLRADLLPHREEVQLIVARSFGVLKAYRISTKDLERVEVESLDALGTLEVKAK